MGFVRKVLIEPGGNFVMTRLVQKVERNCIRGRVCVCVSIVFAVVVLKDVIGSRSGTLTLCILLLSLGLPGCFICGTLSKHLFVTDIPWLLVIQDSERNWVLHEKKFEIGQFEAAMRGSFHKWRSNESQTPFSMNPPRTPTRVWLLRDREKEDVSRSLQEQSLTPGSPEQEQTFMNERVEQEPLSIMLRASRVRRARFDKFWMSCLLVRSDRCAD